MTVILNDLELNRRITISVKWIYGYKKFMGKKHPTLKPDETMCIVTIEAEKNDESQEVSIQGIVKKYAKSMFVKEIARKLSLKEALNQSFDLQGVKDSKLGKVARRAVWTGYFARIPVKEPAFQH